MHKLKLTNGTRLLAHNLLHVQDTFKTPSEVLRAAHLVEMLACPLVTPQDATPEWHDQDPQTIDITEPQRDLLKMVVEKHAAKLPPSKHVVSLLSQLGFE